MTKLRRLLPLVALFFVPTASAQLLPAETPPYPGRFDSHRIPTELQSWWAPNFGHIHAAANLPLGQPVFGILTFDVRIVLHDNPSHLFELRVDTDQTVFMRIPLNLSCPYNGTESTNCAFNVPVALDTTKMPDGWREIRIRATTQTVDGKLYLNSSGVPLYVDNSGAQDDNYNRWCENHSLIGRGWYEDFGYTNAVIECVPLEPVSGTVTFRVRAQQDSNHLMVVLDRTHHIPAVGPWPEIHPRPGVTLFDQDGNFQSFFPITIDTTNLENGWHSLAVRSDAPGGTSTCSYCAGEQNIRSGTAKMWFYVENDFTTTITSAPAAQTNSTEASFSFTASEAGSTFECRLDGSAFAACASPQVYSGLLEGGHAFEVRAVNSLGTPDPLPATHNWTIDSSAPETTITSAPAAQTNSTEASFSFTASEAGSTFACSLDGAAFAPCTTPKRYTGLLVGSHTFSVQATDAAGNTDPLPATHTWTIIVATTALNDAPVTAIITTGSTLTLPSWAPNPNDMILLVVTQRREDLPISVAGNGLTWTEIRNVDNFQGQLGVSMWWAQGATPTTGSIVVTIQGNNAPVVAQAQRFSGVATTNGVEALAINPGPASDNNDMLQAVTTLTDNAWAVAGGGSRTTPTLTLPAGEVAIDINRQAGTSGNVIRGHFWYQGPVSPAGSTQLGQANDLSSNFDWCMIVVSLKPAGAGAP